MKGRGMRTFGRGRAANDDQHSLTLAGIRAAQVKAILGILQAQRVLDLALWHEEDHIVLADHAAVTENVLEARLAAGAELHGRVGLQSRAKVLARALDRLSIEVEFP